MKSPLRLITTLAFAYSAHAGTVLNFFPVSAYNANITTMNATLGISGYTIADFETAIFPAGLSITLSGGVPSTNWTSLPNLFDIGTCPLGANSSWDGTHVATNAVGNQPNSCNTPNNLSTDMTISYSPGATSLGIGFGSFQSLNSTSFPITNHELFVNGVDLGVIETLAGANWTPGLTRNAYLRVDGTAGTLITSIGIHNITTANGQADELFFDHAAFNPAAAATPKPGTVATTVLGCVLLVLWRRRLARTNA